jgi:hypothetical protein
MGKLEANRAPIGVVLTLRALLMRDRESISVKNKKITKTTGQIFLFLPSFLAQQQNPIDDPA